MHQKYSDYYKQSVSEPDKQFIKWINKIEKIVYEKTKIPLLDFADRDYMIMFEEQTDQLEIIEDIMKEYNNILFYSKIYL